MRAKIINCTTFPLFSTQHSFQICCPEVTLFSKRFQNFNKTLPLTTRPCPTVHALPPSSSPSPFRFPGMFFLDNA